MKSKIKLVSKTEIKKLEGIYDLLHIIFYDIATNEVDMKDADQVHIVNKDLSVNKSFKMPKYLTYERLKSYIEKALNEKSAWVNLQSVFKGLEFRNVYYTSYGFGVEVMFMHRTEDVYELRRRLDKLGIKYTNGYSDAHWVYRFKISKSQKNIERIKSISK